MQKRFYFPVALDDAIAVLRRHRRLEQVLGDHHRPIFAYTDRTLAASSVHQKEDDTAESGEVCLLVAELNEHVIGELLMGDYQHFGPTVFWRRDHVFELVHPAAERIHHDGS